MTESLRFNVALEMTSLHSNPIQDGQLDRNAKYLLVEVGSILGACCTSRNDNGQHTWGATKTAEVGTGSSGGKSAVHPEDDSTANASVRTPPSNRVIDD